VKKYLITILILAMILPAFINAQEHKHDPIKPKHGGEIVAVGDHTAALEVLHDAKAGTMTIYVMDAHGTKALGIGDAIKLNVAAEKKTQVTMQAVDLKGGKASTFTVQHAVLKNGHLHGKIVITIGGKRYQPGLPHKAH
jgi:hypothetical protein